MIDLRSALQQQGFEASEKESKGSKQTGFDGKTVQLSIRLEKRKGTKTVTLIKGFQSTASQLDDLLRDLRKRCGAGGSVDDQSIEIQGDHRATVKSHLEKLGYTSIRLI